jgi:hypothetical protein
MRVDKASWRVVATLVFAALLRTVDAGAQGHSLVFTELSGTELTATLDGKPSGRVAPLGYDHWEWISDIYGDRLDWYGGTLFYERPPGAIGVNSLTIGLDGGNVRFRIDSGVLGLDSEPKNPNGAAGSSFAVFNSGATVLGPTTIYFLEQVPEPATFALVGLGGVLLALFRTKVLSILSGAVRNRGGELL